MEEAGAGQSGAVTFMVYGDGRLLARSAPMRGWQAMRPISADVPGVAIIDVVAGSEHRSLAPDPVVWGEAALLR